MSLRAWSWAGGHRVGNPTRKLVLLCLADHADEQGYSYPGVPVIAGWAECVESTARSHLRGLEEAGLVCSVERYRPDGSRTSNGYFLAMPSSPWWNPGDGFLVPEDLTDQATPPPPESGVGPPGKPEGAPPESGGGPTGGPVGVTEPPCNRPSNHPREGDVQLERMHERWTDITDNPRWQLLPARATCYERVWSMVVDLAPDRDPMEVWEVMVRALWSDPWRHEAKSRHAPENVYARLAQVENWVLTALEEMAAGRDGSTWARDRKNGGGHSPDAREEEASLVAKRLQAAARSREVHEEREERRGERWQEHRDRLAGWFEDQDQEVQEEVREEAQDQLEEVWPLAGRPPAGMVTAAKIKALEIVSGITMETEVDDGE